MIWLEAALVRAREGGARFWLESPAYIAQVDHAERMLSWVFPLDYRNFLLGFSNGGVLFHEGDIHASGFQLFGLDDEAYYGLLHINQLFQALFGTLAADTLVIGHTPGVGHAHYVGIEKSTGQVKDCAGSPFQWYTIAGGFTEHLTRMFQAFEQGGDPLYWHK
jgi:hypothetical protein